MNEKTDEITDKLLSLTESAKALGLTRKRVFDFIKDGRLAAQKVGNTYVIKESDLQALEIKKVGKPQAENPSPAALAQRKRREKIASKS